MRLAASLMKHAVPSHHTIALPFPRQESKGERKRLVGPGRGPGQPRPAPAHRRAVAAGAQIEMRPDHSASPVRCAEVDFTPAATFAPDSDGVC